MKNFTLIVAGSLLMSAVLHVGVANSEQAPAQDHATPKQATRAQDASKSSADGSKKKKPGEGGGTDTLAVDGVFVVENHETRFIDSELGKSWKVTNADELKAKHDYKVRVLGTFDSAKGEVRVKKVSMISTHDETQEQHKN